MTRVVLPLVLAASALVMTQGARDPDWAALEPEIMQQYQAVLRIDTRNPPGNERLFATISPPESARYYRDVLSTDPALRAAAGDWLLEHEPQHASMLRTSASPNIFTGGYRSNVIPSEARATLDVRALPDKDPAKFLEELRRVVDDPKVDVHYAAQNTRPATPETRLDSEPFKAIEAAMKRLYGVPTLPSMSTFATDLSQLRAKGMQCFGIGPAVDLEDGPKGFGRFNYEVAAELARAR
jgi:peptidase-like protein